MKEITLFEIIGGVVLLILLIFVCICKKKYDEQRRYRAFNIENKTDIENPFLTDNARTW